MRLSNKDLVALSYHEDPSVGALAEECLAARKILPALSSSAGWCKSPTCENEDCVALREYLRWVRG